MPRIADQVATIEHDLAAALAEIDTLTAANKAFDSANASLRRDNIGLQLEINDMKHFVDDTRAMVDSLAKSALDLLRASRRQVGQPSEVIPFAAGSIVAKNWPMREVSLSTPLEGSLDAKIAALPEKWPAQKAVAEIMAGDSGDEHQPLKPLEPLLPGETRSEYLDRMDRLDEHVVYNNFTPEMQKALEADREKLLQMTGQDHGPTPLDEYFDDADRHMTAAEIATLEEQDAGNANAISSDTTHYASDYRKAVDDVNRMNDKGEVTPVPTNKFEPLPVFLQRDTTFDASANVRPIFG